MVKSSVILTFVACIITNICLKSMDVYSDTTLAFNTLTFNLGDLLVLSGCKVCYGKEDKDIFTVRKSECLLCVTSNEWLQCGNSFEVLNRINDIQQSNKCNNESAGVEWNEEENSFEFINNNCTRLENECCIKNTTTKIRTNSLEHIDKRILVHQPGSSFKYGLKDIRHKLEYDVYILSARLSYRYCEKLYFDYVNWYDPNIKPFLNNVTLLKKPNETEWLYTLKLTESGHIQTINNFTSKDGCGILVKNKEGPYEPNNVLSCGHDSCLVHLQSLKWNLNFSSLDDWKQQTFFKHGRKLGGKTCQLLWQYGLASVVSILLNMFFNIFVFAKDYRSGSAMKFELLFVPLSFYPQWKTLKFLAMYLYDRNEDKLNIAKTQFDSGIGALEPFLEAAFQVHISTAITFAVEGFYPQNSAGYAIPTFQTFNEALPLISLTISMVASSLCMTKFFLRGPIPILPKDSPINGLISFPFICVLLLNSMFVVRVICIEHAFFSYYRYQRYYLWGTHDFQKTIDPIIPPEYRLCVYLAPSFISFIIKHPVLPQIILLIMDFSRGILYWDFIGSVLEEEVTFENNSALFKHNYGNTLFATLSSALFLFLIILTFFTDKLFKNHGNFSNQLSSSPEIERDSSKADGEEELDLDERNSNRNSDKIEFVRTQVYIYSNGSITKITETLLSSAENIALRQIKSSVHDRDITIQSNVRPNHREDNQSIKGQNDRDDECIDTNNARPIDNIVQAEETLYRDIEVEDELESPKEDKYKNDKSFEEAERVCKNNKCKKIFKFIFVVCILTAIVLPLSIIYGYGTSGLCNDNEDCANDRQNCENGACVAKPYTCFSGYCSSFYGKSIKGSNDSIATACAMDSKCKAFRHSAANGFGFLCDAADVKDGNYGRLRKKDGYEDWKLCRIGSITCCPSVLISASTWTMGQLNFYKIGSRGRTIYQSIELSSKQYLYLASDGYWKVWHNYTSLVSGLYHPTCREECPSACSNEWRIFDSSNNFWNPDSSINVSCGNNFINNHSLSNFFTNGINE